MTTHDHDFQRIYSHQYDDGSKIMTDVCLVLGCGITMLWLGAPGQEQPTTFVFDQRHNREIAYALLKATSKYDMANEFPIRKKETSNAA